MSSSNKTVIISCAGMGKRLGIGTTKCLVDVDGTPLIIRHLQMLDDVDDVRIVVGYQADKVIERVLQYRKDVTFVFNHDFAHNGTGASVALASKYANEYILTIDGDLLLHPSDMKMILEEDGEFVGVTAPGTDNPVLTSVEGGNVVEFSRERGVFEWTGVTQLKRERVGEGDGHVYQLIEPHLPMKYLYLRTKEIDTMNDYDNAVRWVRNGCSDDVVIGILGGMGSYATADLFTRLLDAFPAEKEWERPRILIDNNCTMPSRVRAILYGEKRDELVELLAKSTRNFIDSGATHILYACNTSHVFHDEVCARVPGAHSYLVDMIDLLARDMKAAGCASAYLLASEGTIQTGIYQDRFAPHGVAIDAADASQQQTLRDFIELVKQNKVDEAGLERFVEYLASLGEQNIILGCTELPVLFGKLSKEQLAKIPSTVFDPLESAISSLKSAYNAAKEGERLLQQQLLDR